MNDQEFRERVLAWQERTEDWMERTEDWMAQTDHRLGNLEKQTGTVQERRGSFQEGLAWIRGKLEGKHESDAALWGKIAVLVVGFTNIVLLAYFK